jgi:uroporphyrin-3 C-methyltransferase
MSTENSIVSVAPPKAGSPDPQPARPVKSSGSTSGWVALLVALVALSTGVLAWREVSRLKSDTTLLDRIAASEQRVSELQGRLDALGGVQVEMQQGISRLEQADTDMADVLRSLSGSINVSNTDLAVAEIEQLLIMAVHRLTLERDVSTALTILETAELRLASLDEPDLESTRSQLATDISALRAVAPVDIAGLSLYLADLPGRVESLPLNKVAVVETAPAPAPADPTLLPAWQRLLQAVWQEFRSLFVITRTGSNGRATLLPNESWFLYQNLRLQLESARLAVVREDTENLRISLQQIREWLNDYFDTGNSEVSNILQTTEKMAALELSPVLPDISSSLENLRVFIKTRAMTTAVPVDVPAETLPATPETPEPPAVVPDVETPEATTEAEPVSP